MGKTPEQRFDATLDVLSAIDDSLATHITKVMKDGKVTKDTIGADLVLGKRFDIFDRDETTQKRHLIRALLLCQRVYFSKLWARKNFIGGAQQAIDCWPNDGTWQTTREATTQHFEKKSEKDITDAISAFATVKGVSSPALAEAAKAPGADLQMPDVTIARKMAQFPGHKTCYSAVMYWLFKSGITSYRWLLRHSLGAIANKQQFEEIFGQGVDLWRSKPGESFNDTDDFPEVPKGHIVHLYVDIPARYAGHWLVSAGNGKAFGRNNDEEGGMPGGPVDRAYAKCNLKNQFLAYNDAKDPKKPDRGNWEGVATVIDPMKIPNRL
ncbi:MAG TPA: hypothetical protein PKI03_29480 [Pseudomonadota bacterium]|nr:hypothetical protein [Pseudomonadota bacterium]